jgi:hypothetical protein
MGDDSGSAYRVRVIERRCAPLTRGACADAGPAHTAEQARGLLGCERAPGQTGWLVPTGGGQHVEFGEGGDG